MPYISIVTCHATREQTNRKLWKALEDFCSVFEYRTKWSHTWKPPITHRSLAITTLKKILCAPAWVSSLYVDSHLILRVRRLKKRHANIMWRTLVQAGKRRKIRIMVKAFSLYRVCTGFDRMPYESASQFMKLNLFSVRSNWELFLLYSWRASYCMPSMYSSRAHPE